MLPKLLNLFIPKITQKLSPALFYEKLGQNFNFEIAHKYNKQLFELDSTI